MRGYDPYEEAALKAVFKSTFGRQFDDVSDVTQTWKAPEDWSEDGNYTATVIPGQDDTDSSDYGPAPLTDKPTSSSNADRPRTLAAGYQPDPGQTNVPYENRVGKLTVMFRDGTLYNFYEVTPEEWQKFRGQVSKGPMLNRVPVPGFLLSKPHGPADLTNVSASTQEMIRQLARQAQINYRYSGNKSKYKGSITPTAAKRASRATGLAPRSRGKGTNPSKNAGRNPK